MRWNYHDYDLERHLHVAPYADVVISGSYEEAGDLGRFRLEVGSVVLHDAFESHLDRFPRSGIRVLCIELPAETRIQPGCARVADPDAIIRLAKRSEDEAVALVLASAKPCESRASDWEDELANALIQDPSLSLSSWAEAVGLAPWTLCRGFVRVFGITASAFRARSRTRLALKSVQRTQEPLGEIAARLGFADQSHMTRSLKNLTGSAPMAWRTANRFKTP